MATSILAPPKAADRDTRSADRESAEKERTWWATVQSWLLSVVGHTVALILLALLTVAIDRDQSPAELSVFDAQPDEGLATLPPGPLAGRALGEVDGASTAEGPESVFQLSPAIEIEGLDVSLDAAVRPSGLEGVGVGDGGDGLGSVGEGTSKFFGVGGSGRSFVYVVDCSGSMRDDGRFERATEELLRSIQYLSSEQSYFVVFYNQYASPMDADELVPATPEQFEKTKLWVSGFEPIGETNPLPALLFALELKPDVIYFLSDGQFNPQTISVLRNKNGEGPNQVPIHTIAFTSLEGESLMKTISRNSGGQFKFVK